MLVNKSVTDFMELVDSSKPTPGGGSSSALMSSLGISLTRMVGHLTTNRKSFLKLDEEIQNEFNHNLKSLLSLKDKLLPLIDEDAKSFDDFMIAFRLPKITNEEKKIRRAKMDEATLKAIKIPHEISKLSLEALDYIPFILKHGNKSAVSDIGVSILALTSGIEGALYNVLINLLGFKNEEIVTFYKNEVHNILNKTNDFRQNYIKIIYEELEL